MIEQTNGYPTLFDPIPVDPTVRRIDVADLTEQSRCVLSRLERGPASVQELQAAGGGGRIASRVFDLNELFSDTGDPRRIKGAFREGRVYVYEITGGGR